MAEAEGIPPTASVVVPGLSLNYIGSHCYAFSGVKALPSSEEAYLDFITGDAGYIVAKIKISADWSGLGGNELYIAFYINGIQMMFERDTGNNYVPGNLEWPMFLPPNTHLEIKMNASAAQEADVMFIGRVYDV